MRIHFPWMMDAARACTRVSRETSVMDVLRLSGIQGDRRHDAPSPRVIYIHPHKMDTPGNVLRFNTDCVEFVMY